MLEGCKDILEANIQQDIETTLHIQLNANSGKGKLVLVKPNSEVEILVEVTSENNHFEGDVSAKCISGTNKIKIVGENYSGNLEIYQPKEVVFYNIEKVKNKDKKSNENDNDDMFGENFPFEKGDVWSVNDYIYLKFPTIDDKRNWIEYIKEYREFNLDAKPLGCTENIDYEKWLKKINDEHNGINLEEDRVQSSVYFLIAYGKLVGHLSIRHNINNAFLSLYGGQIGYAVRPTERRKGYATIMLGLALEKCKEFGLKNVMITFKENNIASSKVIENNGGVLKEILFIPEENCNFKKYWINAEEALNKKVGDD